MTQAGGTVSGSFPTAKARFVGTHLGLKPSSEAREPSVWAGVEDKRIKYMCCLVVGGGRGGVRE